jgi:hypothetical protein
LHSSKGQYILRLGISNILNTTYVCTTKAEESCDHSTMGVPTTHDGDYEVQVLVHTPKVISGAYKPAMCHTNSVSISAKWVSL